MRTPGDSVRTKMIDFMKKNFADLLGEDVKLLDQEGGLDLLQAKYCRPMRRDH